MERRRNRGWNARNIRALRYHLRLTQSQLAEELGIRQQTVSEWETGAYQPRGTSCTLLSIIAERAAFRYETAAAPNGSTARLSSPKSELAEVQGGNS